MNPELREAIGKAIYVSLTLDAIPWEYLSEMTQEYYRECADKAVETFLAPFLPGIIILGKELIKNNPSMKDTINEVFKQATGRDLE